MNHIGTTFNKRFGFAVERCIYSPRGYLVRTETVAACADRETADEFYRAIKRDNPNDYFRTTQWC